MGVCKSPYMVFYVGSMVGYNYVRAGVQGRLGLGLGPGPRVRTSSTNVKHWYNTDWQVQMSASPPPWCLRCETPSRCDTLWPCPPHMPASSVDTSATPRNCMSTTTTASWPLTSRSKQTVVCLFVVCCSFVCLFVVCKDSLGTLYVVRFRHSCYYYKTSYRVANSAETCNYATFFIS